MAEAETECAAPGLNTLEPECVTAHSGVSDVHHTDASLIKTDTDLGSTHNGHLKTESLDHAELGYVTRLHPEQIKTEPDEGGYLNAEQDIKCVSVQPEHIKSESSEGSVSVSVKPEHIKSESSEGLLSDPINAVRNRADVDQKGQSEEWQCAAEPNPVCKNDELMNDLQTQCGDSDPHCETHTAGNQSSFVQNSKCLPPMSKTVETSLSCVQCGLASPMAGGLSEDLTVYSTKEPYKCSQCATRYKEQSLIQKKRIESNETVDDSATYVMCGSSNVQSYLHDSKSKQKSEKPYKCTQCGKCFKKRSHVNQHLNIHTGEKPYKCTQCGKCFTHKSSLNYHQQIHTGEKPHKCTECGMCFLHKTPLNRHMATHKSEMPYKCTECGKCFHQKYSLNQHLRIHTGENPHKCTHCGKCFHHKHSLTRHLQIHTGEKPYKCTQCGKCFNQRSDLNQHLKIHTGEKPYKCSHCGKCFSHRPNLHQHLKIHTGEKPYKCSQCGKCFSQRGHLDQHLKIHTGEKPYKCIDCGKCFNQKSHLNHHLRIHTGISSTNGT